MKCLTLFILLLTATGINLMAQTCGYEKYYLFALHVDTNGRTSNIPHLKMYLVDEQEKPIMASVSYEEDQQWKHKSDTLFFWEHERLKSGPGVRPLFRQKFFNLGDCYVVAFHMDMTQWKNPETYPLFQVKIEAGLTGTPKESMVVNLPLQKAVSICANKITTDFPLVKPVKTLDGKDFEPIHIVLDQPQKVDATQKSTDELHYAVRFNYRAIPLVNEERNEYVLNEARIYNTHTGKLHQEIYIPRITPSCSKESKNVVRFIDFYNRGIKEAQDFSVQIESWRDIEIKGYRQKINFYIFNTTTKRYELDEYLNQYDDVFYDEHVKAFRRYVFKITSTSRITYTYQLENSTWVAVDTNEAFFTPPPPKIKFPSSNCLATNGREHMLPLQALSAPHSPRMVRDTFWLTNLCDETLHITKTESAVRDFFTIPKTIAPHERVPVILNAVLTNTSESFHIHRFFCSLTLTDGSVIALGSLVPTVSHDATVYYRADSTLLYAVINRPKARFSTVVFCYPNGQLRVKGTIQDNDTSQKVGHWLFFKEGSLESTMVQYSKSVSLSAYSDVNSIQHNGFKVNILENGRWKEPVADYDTYQVKFFITPETDSICAYTDSTRYSFAVSYNKLPMFFSKQFYLLKPGERKIKIGEYDVPFTVVQHQYALILNYSRIKTGRKTTYQLTDSIIAVLQKQFPGITPVWISRNQRGINLTQLEYEEREKVLQQLIRDSSIAYVCQLFYTLNNKQRLSYCDNKVYAAIDIDAEYPEKFRRTALKLGYSGIETDPGGNRFWLTYPSKCIDERFFEAFERLTREKLVFGAYFNSYFEPELDDKERE